MLHLPWGLTPTELTVGIALAAFGLFEVVFQTTSRRRRSERALRHMGDVVPPEKLEHQMQHKALWDEYH